MPTTLATYQSGSGLYSMEGDIAILGTRDVFRGIYRGEVMGVLREALGGSL